VHIFANKRNADGSLPKETLKKRFIMCLVLLFVGAMLQFPAGNIYSLPFLSEALVQSFFKINILQLFAISFMLLLLFFIITKNNRQLALLSFIFGNFLIVISHITLQVD